MQFRIDFFLIWIGIRDLMLAIFRQRFRIQVATDSNSDHPHYTPDSIHSYLAFVVKFAIVAHLVGIPIASFMGSSQCWLMPDLSLYLFNPLPSLAQLPKIHCKCVDPDPRIRFATLGDSSSPCRGRSLPISFIRRSGPLWCSQPALLLP